MTMVYLENVYLDKVLGGVSPKSNGVAGIDAFIDATGATSYILVSNAKGDPAAGRLLPLPEGKVNAVLNYPN